MSKRFGRNQRRRAREAIANLESDVKHVNQALRIVSASYASERNIAMGLQLQISDLKALIGKNHPAFSPGKMSVNHEPTIHPFSVYTGPDNQSNIYPMRMVVDRDTLKNQVHFHLYFDGQISAYAISRPAIRDTEDVETLCHRITEELVRHTIKAWREADTSRGRV